MTVLSFLDGFLQQIALQFKEALPAVRKQLLESSRDAVLENAKRLDEWLVMSSTGQLSEKDLEWLVKAKLDLNKLNALESTGLSLVRIDELRQQVARTLISSIISAAGLR